MDVLRQVLAHDVTPPSRLQPKLHRDLKLSPEKHLAKEPARRYSSGSTWPKTSPASMRASHPGRREGFARKLWRKVRRSPATSAAASGRGRGDGRGGYFAWRYSDARQIALIKQEFQAGLERPDLTAGYLEEMEAHVGPAEPAGSRAGRRCTPAPCIRASRKRSANCSAQPLPEDRSHIEKAWSCWRPPRPELVPELRETLSKRLRDWELVFELKTPFAELGEVLDPAACARRTTA